MLAYGPCPACNDPGPHDGVWRGLAQSADCAQACGEFTVAPRPVDPWRTDDHWCDPSVLCVAQLDMDGHPTQPLEFAC
jgi:hypothetical protein